MNNAEFMQLISTLRDLGHHQRKRLSATLNQVGDEAKALQPDGACCPVRRVSTWFKKRQHRQNVSDGVTYPVTRSGIKGGRLTAVPFDS